MDVVWVNNEGTSSIYFSEEKLPRSVLLRHHGGGRLKEPSFRFNFDWFQRGGDWFNDCLILPRSQFPDWEDLLRYLVTTRFTNGHVIVSRLAESIISTANSIAGGRDHEPLINIVLRIFTTVHLEEEDGNWMAAEAMEGWKNKALGEEESKDWCAICFQKLGRVVKVTPCSHYYHQSCIFQWLNTSFLCPLCRFQLIT